MRIPETSILYSKYKTRRMNRINFKLSDSEFSTLETIAQRDGTTYSQVLRDALRFYAVSQNIDNLSDQLQEILSQLIPKQKVSRGRQPSRLRQLLAERRRAKAK